jgi:hypothetical protein
MFSIRSDIITCKETINIRPVILSIVDFRSKSGIVIESGLPRNKVLSVYIEIISLLGIIID